MNDATAPRVAPGGHATPLLDLTGPSKQAVLKAQPGHELKLHVCSLERVSPRVLDTFTLFLAAHLSALDLDAFPGWLRVGVACPPDWGADRFRAAVNLARVRARAATLGTMRGG